jgi:outer membrane protein TolC
MIRFLLPAPRWWLAILLALPAVAQNPSEPGSLLREVLAGHPAIHKAELRVAAAEARLSGSSLQPNPTLNLAATAGDAGEDSNSLVQTFEVSGQPRLRKEQAQAELVSARLELRAARRTVAGDVMGSWLELWKNEHLARIARLRVALMKETLRAANRRYEVGEIPQNEALRVELAAAEAEADWQRAEAAYRSASRSLSVLRGLIQEAALVPEMPEEMEGPQQSFAAILAGPSLAPQGEPWTLEQVLAATDQHPEVEALRQDQKASLLGAELLRKERAPQLGVSLYRSRFFGSDIEQGAQVFISWPLFDWGSVSARQKAQELEAQAQLAEADEKVLGLRQQVADVWSRWQAARAVREILTAQAARYEELAREARIGYDLGMLSLTDVLQTEASFRAAGVQLIQAQSEVYRFELDLLERTNLPWPTDLLEEQ